MFPFAFLYHLIFDYEMKSVLCVDVPRNKSSKTKA